MRKSFLALASFAAMAVGCQVEPMTDAPVVEGSVVYKAVTEAYAPATKTSMTAEKDVVWSANDEIAVFQGNITYDVFKVTAASVGQTEAGFTLKTEREDNMQTLPYNVAVYPVTEDMEGFYDDEESWGVWGLELPSTQNYASGSFGNGAFPMVAVSADRMFEFKNLLGAMKLQLKGNRTVKSITVTDNAGNQLAGIGGVYLTADDVPAFEFQPSYGSVQNSVTLDCGEGVELNPNTATEFVIALPENEFEKGFTVILKDTEGSVLKFDSKASDKNYIERSRVLVMPELDVETLVQDIEFKAVASTTEVLLDVKVNVGGADGFYGIFASVETWEMFKMYMEYGYLKLNDVLMGQMGTEMPARKYPLSVENLKLTELGLADEYIYDYEITNLVTPNSSYVVLVVPAFADKDAALGMGGGYDDDELGGGVMPLMDLDEEESGAAAGYTLDDVIVYEVSTTGFTTGGNSTLTYTKEEGYLKTDVIVTPSADVAYVYYKVYGADETIPANYLDNFNEYYDSWYEPSEGAAYIEVGNSTSMLPGTSWKLAVILADADGKSTFQVIDVNLAPIPYSADLKVTFGEYGYDPTLKLIYADVTGCPEGAELYYSLVYSFEEDNKYEVAGLQVSALNGEYPFTKVSESNIVNGCYTYESTFNQSTRKQERYLIFAVLKDNKIGDLQAVKIEIPAKS